MYNGTWSKRGHTASYGFVIPVETGQVLDYGFGQRFVLRVTNRRQIRIRMIYKVWHDKLFPKPE